MYLRTIINDLKVSDYQKLRSSTGWEMYSDRVVERPGMSKIIKK